MCYIFVLTVSRASWTKMVLLNATVTAQLLSYVKNMHSFTLPPCTSNLMVFLLMDVNMMLKLPLYLQTNVIFNMM